LNIIGIGKPGCSITSRLEQHSQYNTFYIDSANNKRYKNFSKVKEQRDHEDYETNYRKIRFKNMSEKTTTVVLSGSGKISGIILRLLEQLSDHSLSVVYIKPDLTLLDETSRMREKIVFGILQQYARSGLLENIQIISNEAVEQALKSVSIADYWEDINDVIASTFHMLNVFDNTEPLLTTIAEEKATTRISTIGVVAYDSLDEKSFYNLHAPRLKKYFFGISQDTLSKEKDLLHNIRSYVKGKSGEKCLACFAIYSTDYNENYVYVSHHASLIQEENVYS